VIARQKHDVLAAPGSAIPFVDDEVGILGGGEARDGECGEEQRRGRNTLHVGIQGSQITEK
jgi:hypothetical protein